MSELKWTGERVIPEEMIGKGTTRTHQQQLNTILMEHIARYTWARKFCRGKKVLDSACGSGFGAEILNEVATLVVGYDNSPETIEYARKKYPKPAYTVVDLENIPPRINKNFDIIVSFETIEHLSDPNQFLEFVFKSGAKFIFSIPTNSYTDYHKVIYDWEKIKTLIGKYFNTIEWFEQKKDKIYPFQDGSSQFILGIAENIYE